MGIGLGPFHSVFYGRRRRPGDMIGSYHENFPLIPKPIGKITNIARKIVEGNHLRHISSPSTMKAAYRVLPDFHGEVLYIVWFSDGKATRGFPGSPTDGCMSFIRSGREKRWRVFTRSLLLQRNRYFSVQFQLHAVRRIESGSDNGGVAWWKWLVKVYRVYWMCRFYWML